MAKLSTDELLDAFKEMTLLELSDFVKKFEETFEVRQPAARGRSNPPRWRCDWCKRQEPTPRSPSAASWAR